MKLLNKSIATLALASIFAGNVYAVNARPGLVEAEQPDGSKVLIKLSGDARNHRIYSEDGYLLTIDEEGFYVFADSDSEGKVVPTSIREINRMQRSPQTFQFLDGLNQVRISQAFENSSLRVASSPMRGPGLVTTPCPSMGDLKAIAILVEYPNQQFTIDAKDYFTRVLNEEGYSEYGCTGSARDYFVSNSSGKFTPEFDVYGPVTVSNNYAYYGRGDDLNAYRMIVEACELVDDEVDFSLYDNDGDGLIDNVYVFYAGYGQADGGNSNTIWPHSWDISEAAPGEEYYFDGVKLEHYACSNELQKADDSPDGIGSFCHEFSHVMGLPDLYSTSFSAIYTLAYWNILDLGSYNNNSRTPPNFSSFERYALDWMEPELLSEPGEYTLLPLHESNHAYLVTTDKENEYFLFENRQNEGFDAYLPGHGMLVYHIDFDQRFWDDNIVNTNQSHPRVDLIEADNHPSQQNMDGDPFPGTSNVTEFTSETRPAFKTWSRKSVGLAIKNIREEDGIIYFNVEKDEAGVENPLADKVNFRVEGNTIYAESSPVTVYNLSGVKIGELKNGSRSYPSGIYIVECEGKTSKIWVNNK